MEDRSWRQPTAAGAVPGTVLTPVFWPRVGEWFAANLKRLIFSAIVISLGWGLYSYVSAPASVQYTIVKTVAIDETLGANGKVRGARVAELGTDIAGVVSLVHVSEGDKVSAGSLLLSLDKSELQSRVEGARNSVISAQAEMDKVSRGPLASEVRQAKAELEQAESVGKARIAQAQARLRDLQSGPRPQEIKGAEAELRRRQELLNKAEIDLKRIQQLVKMGALATSELDQAKTAVDTSRSDVTAQQEHISLLKAGARADQVAEARAAVAEALASHQTGASAARERLNTLLSQPRPEDVRAARARVEEARSELRRVLDMMAKADVRAPFDGVVADIAVERGQSVSPGQALAVLHEMTRPVIEVETDEENLSVLAIGQKAVISSDAYPGQTFEAVVSDLGSSVDYDRGTVRIKLRPESPVAWLRPDLTVDVNVITSRGAKRIILPADTITRANGSSVVLVATDDIARPVPVSTGAAGSDGVVVRGNLRDGDRVIRNASSVTPYGDIYMSRRR